MLSKENNSGEKSVTDLSIFICPLNGRITATDDKETKYICIKCTERDNFKLRPYSDVFNEKGEPLEIQQSNLSGYAMNVLSLLDNDGEYCDYDVLYSRFSDLLDEKDDDKITLRTACSRLQDEKVCLFDIIAKSVNYARSRWMNEDEKVFKWADILPSKTNCYICKCLKNESLATDAIGYKAYIPYGYTWVNNKFHVLTNIGKYRFGDMNNHVVFFSDNHEKFVGDIPRFFHNHMIIRHNSFALDGQHEHVRFLSREESIKVKVPIYVDLKHVKDHFYDFPICHLELTRMLLLCLNELWNSIKHSRPAFRVSNNLPSPSNVSELLRYVYKQSSRLALAICWIYDCALNQRLPEDLVNYLSQFKANKNYVTYLSLFMSLIGAKKKYLDADFMYRYVFLMKKGFSIFLQLDHCGPKPNVPGVVIATDNEMCRVRLHMPVLPIHTLSGLYDENGFTNYYHSLNDSFCEYFEPCTVRQELTSLLNRDSIDKIASSKDYDLNDDYYWHLRKHCSQEVNNPFIEELQSLMIKHHPTYLKTYIVNKSGRIKGDLEYREGRSFVPFYYPTKFDIEKIYAQRLITQKREKREEEKKKQITEKQQQKPVRQRNPREEIIVIHNNRSPVVKRGRVRRGRGGMRGRLAPRSVKYSTNYDNEYSN
jgi:hypothetical protein